MGISNYPSQSGLNRPPTAIINADSAGSTASIDETNIPLSAMSGVKRALSGALTANTYKAVLTVTGSGIIDICALVTEDATERTIGLKIAIDGTDVFDAVSSSITAGGDGICGIGIVSKTDAGAMGTILPQPRVFNSSLVVSVKSNVAGGETDKLRLDYTYCTT